MEECEVYLCYEDSIEFMKKLMKHNIVFKAEGAPIVHFRLLISPAQKLILGGLL